MIKLKLSLILLIESFDKDRKVFLLSDKFFVAM